ncbi:hypothetical protein [Streptomyces agglomeratus]|uniref:hypothetical protein n=1 Tax=Streptomyces agglomeratus TaxID=285458 RepID=UPI0019D0BF9D|nr:hypothetical protein [Streptomyces agglomeratus]
MTPLVGEEAGGQVGAVNIEGLIAVALGAESGVVQKATQKQQFVVIVAAGLQALLLSEEAPVKIAAHAVVEDCWVLDAFHEAHRAQCYAGTRKEQFSVCVVHHVTLPGHCV